MGEVKRMENIPDYHRIIHAILELQATFESCGLQTPVAIVVKPGEKRRITSILTPLKDHLSLQRSDITKIYGVNIWEESDALIRP